MNTDKHLYMILYPNCSLVGSQYSPEQFAKHYMSGSTRYYTGKLVFAEIDINFRNPYFKIDKGLEELVPHPDGRPKATKFICSYRVLEHIDFGAIKSLYLSTPEGYILELKEGTHDAPHLPGFLRTFAEIEPLHMLVLTKYNFVEFGKNITDPNNTKGAPKFFYTQIELDTKEFLKEFEENPFMQPPLLTIHPSKLRDAIHELSVHEEKNTKGLALNCPLDQIPYKMIRHGFMFASQEETLYFPMPSLEEIERTNYRFWRSM